MSEKPRILLIDFPNRYLLSATFMRFQEHYESPDLHGQVFTLERCMDRYAFRNGDFTYLSDYFGHNVPSRVFRVFRAGKFDPLTRKESALLELVQDVPEPFYVIGTHSGQTRGLAHETLHGLFYAFPAYRREVERRIRRRWASAAERRARSKACRILADTYHKSVMVDEMNAYAVTGWFADFDKSVTWPLRGLRSDLWEIFYRHFGIDLSVPRNCRELERFVTRVPFAELNKLRR